jgi:hypothetical protein
VVPELPSKTNLTESVEMEVGLHAIYESMRLAVRAKVQAAIAENGLTRSGILLLDAQLKPRQDCCNPLNRRCS